MKTLLLLLLPIQLIAQATFTHTSTALDVEFIVTSPTTFVYEWNYGDGTMDTVFSDTSLHTYPSTGTFFVKMRVFDTTFLLLDSASGIVTLTATGIEETPLPRLGPEGDLFLLNGRFFASYTEGVPPGIYILVTKTGAKKIYIP